MPESLLRILNGCLLFVLLLFFLRVLRAAWVQVNAPPIQPPVAAAAPPQTQPAPRASNTDGLRLRVLEPADHRGQLYELGDEVTVGRAPGCGVSLPDTTVSQLHARVFRRDGRIYVEDLGSTNGTWLNRARVSAAVPLKRGDRLQVGSTVLEVAR
jgi:pSer/pThr/pTyr-binding forkhead associated (FHA) protein